MHFIDRLMAMYDHTRSCIINAFHTDFVQCIQYVLEYDFYLANFQFSDN